MTRKSISWILKFTSELPNDEEKVKCLRANDNTAVRAILQLCFHPGIHWALPEGEPPYKPCEYPHQEQNLYKEIRRLYLFLAPECGGNANLKPLRRESLFIEMLQELDPEDAKLMCAIKDKIMPYSGLTSVHVQQAFPGLI